MTEKELILTHVLKCRRADLHFKEISLTAEQNKTVEQILGRRSRGEPLQYILGECEFMGYPLKVDDRVLIPRPETERLVEIVVEEMTRQKDSLCLGLDIGTGSGNITIALLQLIKNLRMTALDISQEALDVARDNALLNKVENRVEFIKGDVFKWLNADNVIPRQYSLIVSNPPYIRKNKLATLPDDVKKEPLLALDGGDDGLMFYKHIISNSTRVLKPGGWLFFEIGEEQGKSLDNLLTRQGSFVNIQVIKDFNQRDRIIKAQLKS